MKRRSVRLSPIPHNDTRSNSKNALSTEFEEKQTDLSDLPTEVISNVILGFLDDMDLTNLNKTSSDKIRQTSLHCVTGTKFLYVDA